jgi:NAD+ synthase
LDLVSSHIVDWLKSYCDSSNLNGFVVGISGGIDSAVTSILCAQTGKRVILLNMPIRQHEAEYKLAQLHISDLKNRYPNVDSHELDLSSVFSSFENVMPFSSDSNLLSMANSRARLRMMALYAVGQANGLLVTGTGNKVEDFGIGFYTKYGDGGVDLSPIADLMKSEVFGLARYMGVVSSILNAAPTDGLWNDDRSDEDQIGATYDELEWAMQFDDDLKTVTQRELEVLRIYRKMHAANLHKMNPIPVCEIPIGLK